MGLWNAHSLVNKLNHFQSAIYSKCYDLFCVTETWLHEHIHNSEILPTNYRIYRNDRGSRGGGVLIAVSNDIPSKLTSNHSSIEMITVEISLSPKLIIVCLYIPPNCSDDYQQETLRILQSLPSDCDVILTGDLNAPDINWSTYCGNSLFSISLCNLFCSHNYIQMVTTPTHRQGGTLDLIITNSPHRLLNLCVDPTGQSLKSDHYLVTADIASISSCTNLPNQGVTYTLNYSNADMPGLIQYLNYALVCRSLILPLRSADILWAELNQAILDNCQKYVPRVRIPSKPTPRWFISAIRHQLNRTRTLRRLTRKCPTQHLLSKFKKHGNFAADINTVI